MRVRDSLLGILMVLMCLLVPAGIANAQSNSGSISGTVVDPSGAVVAGAPVQIHNPVSGYDRTTPTDSSGNFNFPNVPFNPYHLSVTATGFAALSQDVDVRSGVPVTVKISLTIAGASNTGARVAVYNVDRKSSAIPFAILPMMFAVAGAMRRRSIVDAIAMCSMSAFVPGSN